MTEVHYEVHNGEMEIVLSGEVQSPRAMYQVYQQAFWGFMCDEYGDSIYIKMWKVKEDG